MWWAAVAAARAGRPPEQRECRRGDERAGRLLKPQGVKNDFSSIFPLQESKHIETVVS